MRNINYILLALIFSIVSKAYDPFEDNHISCEEMEEYPELVFKNPINLGTGAGSPNSVEWECSNSIRNIMEFENTLNLIDESYGERTSYCYGTMVYAGRRYQLFDYLKMSFYSHGYNHLKNQEISFETSQGYNYFLMWSFDSFYNRDLYLEIMHSFAKLRPKLIEYYNTKNTGEITSIKMSEYVLKNLMRIAAGVYPGSRSEDMYEIPKFTQSLVNNEKLDYDLFSTFKEYEKTTYLKQALILSKNVDIINQLVKEIKDINSYQNESVLNSAVRNVEFIKILLENGADINIKNNFGKTPLFYAVQLATLKEVQFLVENGANINEIYFDKETLGENDFCYQYTITGKRSILMQACQHANLEVVKYLIEKGADINHSDEAGDSITEYAERSENEDVFDYIKSIKK